jgi:hypothetical protein
MIWNQQKRVLAIPAILFLTSIASECTLNRAGLPGNDSAMICKAQVPSIIFRYINKTSSHITPGQMNAKTRLYEIPPSIFPLLITIVVTSMSGMFSLFSRVLTHRIILTLCSPSASVAYLN